MTPKSTFARLLLAICGSILGLAWAEFALAGGGQLEVTVVDRDSGEPIACRMHLFSTRSRTGGMTPYRQTKSFIASPDPSKDAGRGKQRSKRAPFWHDHVILDGRITLRLPKGNYFFEMERGPEYLVRTGRFTIDNFADDSKQVDMRRFVDMSADGWWSGDLHVRRPAKYIELLMLADDLHVVPLVTWPGETPPNKVKTAGLAVRFDGNRYYSLTAGKLATPGGTLLLFNLPKPLELGPADREFPSAIDSLEPARADPNLWVDLTKPFWWDLPMLVAADQIDSIEIAHGQLCRKSVVNNESGGKPRDKLLFPGNWGNARWSQEIYFRLLECGLRIPPSAGSGSGEGPNPLGYNRMYVHVDSQFSYEKWWDGFRAGRVTITNGPLLRPRVEGHLPGHVFRAEQDTALELEIGLTLSTRQPISYLEIIKNGKVEHSVRLADYAKTGKLPKLKFERSGWFLIRATTDLQETYRFAMTGPYYVEIGYQPRVSKRAAQFFLDWVYERARQIAKIEDPSQRRAVMQHHRAARDFWKAMVAKANVE